MVQVQADTLKVELCAPERNPVRLDASELILPGSQGVFTVLPGHTTLLSTLTTGVVQAQCVDGETKFFAVNGGFAEVNQDRVIVLTLTAEADGEVDVERAEAARERAEQRLQERGDDVDLDRAQAALERALARLMTQRHQGY
ncbi:MAG: F0F1 ATP synthase subunit epsilon [Candidatus Hydrogenedentes bacterium]|nr:F0F1 ATP synthase subunit epsilon [Candidatus Hydrogenedentota bacterium]